MGHLTGWMPLFPGRGFGLARPARSDLTADMAAKLHLEEIAESARSLEAFAAQLPALWRRSKFRVKGLKKAEKYNDCLCVVKTVVEGRRFGVQLLNEDKSELSIRRENIELVDHLISESSEPEIYQALERLHLSRSADLPETKEGVSSATVNWARGLLDITYKLEIIIIDAEFVDRDSFLEVRSDFPA